MAIQVDRSLALPPSEFFPTQEQKSGICLHHTVGGTAASSVNHWKTDGVHVGTAYMIGRDGTIFEIFDPRNWAFQFGLRGWGTYPGDGQLNDVCPGWHSISHTSGFPTNIGINSSTDTALWP